MTGRALTLTHMRTRLGAAAHMHVSPMPQKAPRQKATWVKSNPEWRKLKEVAGSLVISGRAFGSARHMAKREDGESQGIGSHEDGRCKGQLGFKT